MFFHIVGFLQAHSVLVCVLAYSFVLLWMMFDLNWLFVHRCYRNRKLPIQIACSYAEHRLLSSNARNWIKIPLMLFVIVFLPILYSIAKTTEIIENRRERERKESQKQELKEKELRRTEINQQREQLRQAYFVEHPPKLYYNTLSGVTAVLSPQNHILALKETEYAILDGRWTDEQRLLPFPGTAVFATVSGMELVSMNTGRQAGVVSGYISKVHDLAERYSITLERDPRIFVPWVNEGVLPFKEHTSCCFSGLYEALYLVQAPKEMRPIC